MSINIDYEIDDSKVTDLLEKAIDKKITDKFSDDGFLDKVKSVVNQQVAQQVKKCLLSLMWMISLMIESILS